MIEKEFTIEYDSTSAGRTVHLAGLCLTPDGERECYPAIILAHEFASNMKSTRRFAIPLCQAGYQVYIFDYAGTSLTKSRGRSDREASILTEKEEFEQVYQYVRKQSCVDLAHIIVGGCSQGGMGAALVAGEHPEEIEKLIMYYPALCGPDYLRKGYMMGKQFDPANPPEYLEMFHGTGIGKKFMKDFASLDPWKEIKNFFGPVLICHGTADDIADIAYAREAQLQYLDCTLVEIEGGRHIFKEKAHFLQALEATMAFLG